MTLKIRESCPPTKTPDGARRDPCLDFVDVDMINDGTQKGKSAEGKYEHTHNTHSARIRINLTPALFRLTQPRSAIGRAAFGLAVAALLFVVFSFCTSVSNEMQLSTQSQSLGTTMVVCLHHNTSSKDPTNVTAGPKPSTLNPDGQIAGDVEPPRPLPLLHVHGEFRLNTVPQPNNGYGMCENPALSRPLCDAQTGCSPTLFENALPHFHSLGGTKKDLGPAARQWLAALQIPASYLIRGSEPFAINFTIEQPTIGSDVVVFTIHETHTVVANDNFKRRPVGGELGGSSYRAHVITRAVGAETNVTKLVTLCKIEDHFNGSYTVQCPVAVSAAVLFRFGAQNVTVSADVHLDYTHFNGFEVHPVRPIDLIDPSELEIETSKLYNFPVLTETFLASIEQPHDWKGDKVLRPCTQDEAWAAGDFGGTWIKWRGDQGTGANQNLTYVPASMCSLTDWDTAGGNFRSKNRPLRSQLKRCLLRNDRGFLLTGASHARFSFDEIADRIGVRDPNEMLHHFDHVYFRKHLIHQHSTFFDEVIGQMDEPISLIREGCIPRGFRQDDIFLLQTGAWNLAHCTNMEENLPRLDIVMEKLHELVSITNATVVLSSSPPYSWNEFDHRWYRRNPTLQALAEVQKAFVVKIGDRIKFLDFFTMALPKADLTVCINHYVCPRNSRPDLLDDNPYDVMMGVVGKRVVDALLTGVCGPAR